MRKRERERVREREKSEREGGRRRGLPTGSIFAGKEYQPPIPSALARTQTRPVWMDTAAAAVQHHNRQPPPLHKPPLPPEIPRRKCGFGTPLSRVNGDRKKRPGR